MYRPVAPGIAAPPAIERSSSTPNFNMNKNVSRGKEVSQSVPFFSSTPNQIQEAPDSSSHDLLPAASSVHCTASFSDSEHDDNLHDDEDDQLLSSTMTLSVPLLNNTQTEAVAETPESPVQEAHESISVLSQMSGTPQSATIERKGYTTHHCSIDRRNGDKLGLLLYSQTKESGIRVHSLQKGGAADKTQVLEKNDIVVCINEVSCHFISKASYQYCVATLDPFFPCHM